jgi:hypothetical protein
MNNTSYFGQDLGIQSERRNNYNSAFCKFIGKYLLELLLHVHLQVIEQRPFLWGIWSRQVIAGSKCLAAG